MKLRRIDSGLACRGPAKSRATTTQMIENGHVKLDGQIMLKLTRQMDPAQAIVVEKSDDPEYASCGAHKLTGAFDALDDKAPLIGRHRALDAGALTGGFTDVLLRCGAASVAVVDAGYGQLAWKLQSDPRVKVCGRTSVRTLGPALVALIPESAVGDMSFISLTLVLLALAAVAAPRVDFLLMIKSQFEIDKERLGHGGVVCNPEHHVETVEAVARYTTERSLDIVAITTSPLPGPSDDVEYLIHIRRGYSDPIDPTQLTDYVRRAVEAGLAGGSR